MFLSETMPYARPETIRVKKSLIKNQIWPYFDLNSNLGEIDSEDIHFLTSIWKRRQLSLSTQKMLFNILKDWTKYWFKQQLNVEPYIRGLMKSQQEQAIKALDRNQAEILLRASAGKKLYLPVLLALHTGMRRGEVFGLQLADIDIFTKRVMIQRSYNGPTKNGRCRIVPISETLEKAILNQERWYCGIKQTRLIKDVYDPNPRLKTLCRKNGLPEITFHSLRHSFATLALEEGISPKVVQELLGHSKVSTTLDIYWQTLKKEIDLGFLPKL